MNTVIIIRSVSGSGKTTLAKQLTFGLDRNLSSAICEADTYFTDEKGNYRFFPEGLGAAHAYCRNKFKYEVDNGTNLIIVSNTNTTYDHFKYYLEYGKSAGYEVFVMTLENYHGNKDLHNVPPETLTRQESQLRQSIKLR